MKMNKKALGTLYVIVSAILFGFNPLISKSAYAAGSNPIMVTFFRMVFTGLIMSIVYMITTGKAMKVSREEFKNLLICAQGYCFTPLLLFSSYNYIDSGMSGTIHFVYPIIVLLGELIFLKKDLSLPKKISCIICFAGILLMGSSDAEINMAGFLLSFASAVTFAFYVVYLANSGLQKMHAYKMAGWLCFISMAEIFPVLVFTGSMVPDLRLSGWFFIVLFSIVNGSLASTFFQLGTKFVGAPSASMLSTFEPLTCIIVGVIVYHEVLTVRSVAGMVCVLLAVTLVAYNDLRSREG